MKTQYLQPHSRSGFLPGLSKFLQPAPWFPLLILAYVLVHLAFIWWGRFVGDEGYYLYSSTLVMRGLVPYKDFAFWQPPAILYVYGLAGLLYGHSLLLARCFSALLGLGAFVLMAGIVRRRANAHAVLVLAILIALSLSYAYDTSVVKSQSLTIFAYALALAVATRGPLVGMRCVAASILMALAVSTRTSTLPMLPLFWGYVWLESGFRRSSLLWSMAVSTVVLGGGFLAFLWLSDGNVLFGLWGFYKKSWPGEVPWDFTRWYMIHTPEDQALCYALLAGVLAWAALRKTPPGMPSAGTRKWVHRLRLEIFLLASWAAITFLQVNVPVKYPTHQITNMPLLVMFLALVLGRRLAEMAAGARRLIFGVLIAVALATIPLQNFQFLIAAEKNVIAPFRAIADIVRPIPLQNLLFLIIPEENVEDPFRNIADIVRPWMTPNSKLLCYSPIIAYEGPFDLIEGMSIGTETHFGAYGMSTEECRKYKGVDNRILLDYLTTRAANVVIFQRREFSFVESDRSGVSREQIRDAVLQNYEVIARFYAVGQFGEPMVCCARKHVQ